MQNMLDKTQMPASMEAEKYIIGCLLIYQENTEDILNQISSEDFYYPEYKTIMEAIENVHKNGIVDQTTVIDELIKTNKLALAGGENNIFNIIADIPSVANIDAYADLINKKSMERKLFNAVDKIREDILKGSFDHDELMFRSETLVNNIFKAQRSDDFYRIDALTSDIITMIENNKARGGSITGLDTGYPAMDALTNGFKKGELIILAARPSIGKSTLALNIAENVCKTRKSVALFSLEMGEDQLITRMLSTFSGIDLSKITTGNLTDDEMSLVLRAKQKIDSFDLYINKSSTTSLKDIKIQSQQLQTDGKLDLIIIDYLQLLDSGEKDSNRVNEVSRISRGLKEMARIFNVPVLALSQLSRDIEKRQDKTPVLADLRESGSIEQDADIVMFLHRDVPVNQNGDADTTRVVTSAKTDVIIAKNRQGMTGRISLIFKGKNSLFSSMED